METTFDHLARKISGVCGVMWCLHHFYHILFSVQKWCIVVWTPLSTTSKSGVKWCPHHLRSTLHHFLSAKSGVSGIDTTFSRFLGWHLKSDEKWSVFPPPRRLTRSVLKMPFEGASIRGSSSNRSEMRVKLQSILVIIS